MKVEEVPFENLTLEELMELAQNGAKAIVDGDKRVVRIIPEGLVDGIKIKAEAPFIYV
jgi:hypothetical protein